MVNVEEYPLGDLPEAVIAAAARDVVNYSIGFLGVKSPPQRSDDVMLLGSGTLVSVGSTCAILTAHHVLSALPRSGRLGLILSPTAQQHTVDTQGLAYVEIARGRSDSEGPDLGAIVLGTSIASSIGAMKSYYRLDFHRNYLLNSPPHIRDGFWFDNGFVDECTVEEQDKEGWGLVKGFYNLSGAGGQDHAILTGGHDYFAFPVSYGGRSVAPKSFGGMSGGGLWQVPLARDAQRQIKHETPLLSGVVFYQEPTTEMYCGVKCHGRMSVYNVAFEAIEQKRP
jgi:hypothetical protein